MEDISTKLKIEAELAGVEKAIQESKRLEDALAPKDVIEGFERLEAMLDRIGTGLARLGQQGAQSLEVMERGFDRIHDKAKRTNQEIERTHASFSRGLIQGVGLGEFYPSSNMRGQLAQVGGRMAGQMARGVMSGPFTGMGGIQTALSAIPGGGVIAGSLQQGIGFAEQALAFESMELGSLPLLDVSGGLRAARGVNMRGDIMANIAAEMAGARAWQDSYGADRAAIDRVAAQQGIKGVTPSGQRSMGGVHLDALVEKAAEAADAAQAKAEEQVLDQKQRAGEARAFREAATGPIDVLRRRGLEYGYGEDEALQFGAAAAETAGGFARLGNRSLGLGLAANRVLGVSAGTVGAIAGGATRGAFTGAGGGPADTLEGAVARGLALGLERTEVRDRLDRMAMGFEEWKRTGIKFDAEGIDAMAAVFRPGVGGLRGIGIAEGVRGGTMRIATEGPQDVMDQMILQQMGFRGGGFNDYQKALVRLERGEFGGGQLKEMLQGFGGGDPEAQMMIASGFLGRKFGVQSPSEQRRLSALLLGDNSMLDDRERGELFSAKADAILNGEDALGGYGIEAAARIGSRGIGGNVLRSKGIEAQGRAAGRELMGPMLDLSETTVTSARALSQFAPEIKTVTTGLRDLSKAIKEVAGWMTTLSPLRKD